MSQSDSGRKFVIAFLGTGAMGLPMATLLCQAGHAVHAWNRTVGKAQPLAAYGATVHERAADAVHGADIVISMLENGPVVTQVLFGPQGVAPAMKRGALFVDMASIMPREAVDHARRLAERGVGCLDAPVSGGTVAAQDGTLAIMAGGSAADFERALPVFAALGRATHVGPAGAGQLAKLANQMIVGITISAVAEALLFAAKGGADMAKVREAISGGFADSRILQVHGQRMVEKDFEPRARMAIQLKDLRNALATAEDIGFDCAVASRIESLYAEGIAHGLTDLDHAGVFVELAHRNGMDEYAGQYAPKAEE